MSYDYSLIPDELKRTKQWVCWAGSKLPKNPYTGGNAMSNNPSTWGTFDDAVCAIERFHLDGIGFMFAPPYFGVDLDKCIDNEDFVDEFVNTLGSYAEYSKSGNGIHIICRGVLPDGGRRRGNVEMYSEGRFFIMTGKPYNGEVREITECTETIKILHSKHIQQPESTVSRVSYEKLDLRDDEIIDMARQSKNGIYFQALYEGSWQGAYTSQSEADLAFCNMLAFWTQRDYAQMDRIFRSSGLYRKKWDERRGGLQYSEKTLQKAISACKEVYKGQKDKPVGKIIAFQKDTKKEKQEYKDYELTDTGNGRRMADLYGDILHYSQNRKKWFFWDGKCWREDDTMEVRRIADKVIEQIRAHAFSCEDEDKQEQLLKWANRTAGTKPKDNMIRETEHRGGIAIPANFFDVHDDLINMDNGVVNLRNGELTEHDPSYNMSKIAYASYSTSGTPTRWLQFLDEITDGNLELQEYLQKAVGYTMTASIKEQCLFFLFGNGCNGKSTFVDVISDLLGSYASNAQAETIMQKKQSAAVNSDIARLSGARLVTVAEPEEGVRLNESLVKQLVGGDKITARFLFGDEFEYRPKFKLWISTNHKPVIRGTDEGIWRRIVLIPFTVRIPADKIDKGLSHKLRKELPEIAKWAVDGCIKWQQEGLKKPECIQQATDEYRSEMDVLSKFVADCVEETWVPDAAIKASVIYEVYQNWCRDTNEYEHTATRFGKDFSAKFPEKERKTDGLYYKQCVLTDYAKKNYLYRAEQNYQKRIY